MENKKKFMVVEIDYFPLHMLFPVSAFRFLATLSIASSSSLIANYQMSTCLLAFVANNYKKYVNNKLSKTHYTRHYKALDQKYAPCIVAYTNA